MLFDIVDKLINTLLDALGNVIKEGAWRLEDLAQRLSRLLDKINDRFRIDADNVARRIKSNLRRFGKITGQDRADNLHGGL